MFFDPFLYEFWDVVWMKSSMIFAKKKQSCNKCMSGVNCLRGFLLLDSLIRSSCTFLERRFDHGQMIQDANDPSHSRHSKAATKRGHLQTSTLQPLHESNLSERPFHLASVACYPRYLRRPRRVSHRSEAIWCDMD